MIWFWFGLFLVLLDFCVVLVLIGCFFERSVPVLVWSGFGFGPNFWFCLLWFASVSYHIVSYPEVSFCIPSYRVVFYSIEPIHVPGTIYWYNIILRIV